MHLNSRLFGCILFRLRLIYEAVLQNRRIDTNTVICLCYLSYCLFASGDIGGSMGLFVGGSIITIIELFDVAVHTLLRRRMSG